LVGLDLNEDCVRQYTGGYVDKDPSWAVHPPAGRKRLGYVGSALQLPFSDGCFDEIRSSSFFHHLSDAQTETALKEMERCVHSGGRLVMFDAVWPKRAWTRPIAWLVGKYDRGHYFRTEEQLAALFEKSCPGEWRWERHTYTFTGLELLCLQYEKK
jgi:SAM-dependent methyltransferase